MQQLHPLPPLLAEVPLHELRRAFMDSIRHYNDTMAFASVSTEVDAFRGRGTPTYQVHAQVYHFLGPALPPPG